MRARFPAALRRVPAIVIVPIAAFLALSAWALSSPAGSSPDDDFHLSSIWCGVGDRDGLCAPGDAPDEREVARDLVIDAVCYAYDATASGACQGDDFGTNPDDTVSTPRGNFEGLYPPVYYFVTGLFASVDIDVSVVAIRIVNAVLFIGLHVAAFLLLPRHRRSTLLWSATLTAVPLGAFLIASTNPSGWAVLSANILWISVAAFFETTGARRWGLAALMTVATVMGAGARADSALYAIVAVALGLFLAFRVSRSFLLGAILPIALAVVSALFYLSASQGAAVSTGLTGAEPPTGAQWRALALANLVNAPDLWVGAFGRWGLGWLDTPMPALVWVVSSAAFVAAIVIAAPRRIDRRLVAMAGVVALLFLLPTYLLTTSGASVGAYVQPRYILPLLVILVGIGLWGRGRLRASPLVLWFGAAALAIANSLALFTNLSRYTSGLDDVSLTLSDAEWWWDAAPAPLVVWLAGSAAFAIMLAALARWTMTSRDLAGATPADPSESPERARSSR